MATLDMLSIIIPVYNNADGVCRTVSALGSHIGQRTDVEVLVVDDGSSDGTADVVSRLDLKMLRLVRLTDNAGAAAARNAGAAEARGNSFIFMDANDEPNEDWLASFTAQLADGVAIAHCKPRFSDPGSASRHGELLPGCFAIGRGLFEALGGYDARLRFGENADLVERAHRLCDQWGLYREHESAAAHDQ